MKNKAFLLRFEEAVGEDYCGSEPSSQICSSTRNEDGTSRAALVAGTKTLTEIKREGSDRDRAAHNVLAFSDNAEP